MINLAILIASCRPSSGVFVISELPGTSKHLQERPARFVQTSRKESLTQVRLRVIPYSLGQSDPERDKEQPRKRVRTIQIQL